MRPLFLALALLVALAVQARATEYSYSTTVDLSTATIDTFPTQNSQFVFDFPSSVTGIKLAVGDTVSGTITFDQALTLTEANPGGNGNFNANFSWAPTPTAASDNSDSYSLTLDGLQGTFDDPNPNTGTASGGGLNVGIGGIFSSDTLSFTGITYSFTVTSEFDQGLTYVPSTLNLTSNFSTVSLTAAPEPSTMALMVIDFAGLALGGAWIRRREDRFNRA